MQPETSPYDFILSNGPQQKKSFGLGGGSMKKRIMVVLVVGVIFLMVVVIAFSLLFGGGKGNSETLLSIALQQAKLVSIAEAGTTKARGSAAQNLAITTKLSISSSNQDLLAYMKKQGQKIDPKLLVVAKNSKTDATLTAAEQNNRYDETFNEIIKQELTSYQTSIKKAHNETEDKTGKLVLTNAFNQAEILLK